MKSVSGREFARLLERHGWELKRVKGSHHIFIKSGNSARISVPIHSNSPPKVGLLRHFLKVSEIDEGEL